MKCEICEKNEASVSNGACESCLTCVECEEVQSYTIDLKNGICWDCIEDKYADKVLSDEDKEKYLESPHHCPYCGSSDIDADRCGYGQDVECSQCGRRWLDILTVTDIIEL